jgi:hypothetical protein
MLTAKLVLLVLVGQSAGASSESPASVEQLGATADARREAARELASQGSKALPALRSALKSSDPGIRSRASAQLQKIEGNILLQGAKVKLDYQEVTAAAVLESISNQMDSDLTLTQQKPNSAGPRITLRDPNPVSFWNAIDRFCEAANVVCDDQFGAFPAPPVAGRGLVFSHQPDHVKVPSYNYGAFRIKVVMLFYHNELSYFPGMQAADRMRTGAHVLSPDGKLDGEVMRNPRARKETLPANTEETGRQGRAEESRNPIDRTDRFRVELQIVPDRRMEITFNGPPKVLEAVDELGNSLLPTSRSEENGYAPMRGMMLGGFPRSADGPASVFLHRPRNPGKFIKKLRGTLDVSIAARWPQPVVLPLKNAAGKLLESDEMRVVVKSIETDPAGKPRAIELTIEELDLGAPEERSNDFTAFAGHWRLLHGALGIDSPLSRIQVVDSRGRVTFTLSGGSQQGSGPLLMNLTPCPGAGESKEFRLSTIVRASAKIPFVFEHLPMP